MQVEGEFARSPTLMGILTRLRAGGAPADDRELRDRLDHAFSKHYARLRAFVARELRGLSDQQVEETVQDVLLVAWNELPKHDGRNFRAWLYAIAANACSNARRKRRDVLSEDGLFDPGSEAESVYAALRRAERSRLFVQAARRVLDSADQDVMVMRYELELPYEEIARLAGLSGADEVRVILQRGKRKLGRELEAMLREHGQGRSLFDPDQ